MLHPGKDCVTANVKEPCTLNVIVVWTPQAAANALVAIEMCARVLARRVIALLSIVVIASSEEITCDNDGLYADYKTQCREYVHCNGGSVKKRYTCSSDRVFSDEVGNCVSRRRQPCTRRICAQGDKLAYATPGTACRHYYRCENGTAFDHACPTGSWFDLERQACSRGAGTCYEPICAGLPDGDYPDSSHECRREVWCRGGELHAVVSCGSTCVPVCPPPRSAAIPIPVGDADFCSDAVCSSLCQRAPDGAYADRYTGCREYFVCEAHRVIRRGVCEPGLLFSGSGCEQASRIICPAPARSPCFNRRDGLHRDWRDCSTWFECHRERVVSRGSCERGKVFNDYECVSKESFYCEGSKLAEACMGMPTGIYQDLESNCTRYFHCHGHMRTTLACQAGQIYDGVRCSPSYQYQCPSLDPDSCYGRPDGRYRASDAGCRGFYACFAGEKSVYACPAGQKFDGDNCVPAHSNYCPLDDYSCSGLADGYHAELESNCHRYFYCEGGDRLTTLSCLGGKIFDGHACVESSQHICGALRSSSIENGKRYCERDGFFVQQGTECKSYYFCVTGVRTFLSCPSAQVFNGQICVPREQYTCPG